MYQQTTRRTELAKVFINVPSELDKHMCGSGDYIDENELIALCLFSVQFQATRNQGDLKETHSAGESGTGVWGA